MSMTSKVASLVACAVIFLANTPNVRGMTGQGRQRRVIVLVDESGTLRTDPGLRNSAAALLAHSLDAGSSLAISGFGNPGRELNVEPLPIGDSGKPAENRRLLAERAYKLGDSDKQTDIYGAIRAAVNYFSTVPPSAREAAPPVLIVFSDFRPDPLPSVGERDNLCRDLGTQSKYLDFIAVGFGSVDAATMQNLVNCASGLEWGGVTDASSLLGVFWRLQHRLTQAVPVDSKTISNEDSEYTPNLPPWADGGLLLASGGPPHWDWVLPSGISQIIGKGFRLVRIPTGKSSGAIRFQRAKGVTISLVAFGDLEANARSASDQPYLRGEAVQLTAELSRRRSGSNVSEWRTVASNEASARWEHCGESVSLLLKPGESTFTGFWKAGAPISGTACLLSIDIGGGHWEHEARIEVRDAAFHLEGVEDGKVTRGVWRSGDDVSLAVRTDLGNRAYQGGVAVRGMLPEAVYRFEVGPGRGTALIAIRTGEQGSTGWLDLLRALVHPPAEREAVLRPVMASHDGVDVPAGPPVRLVISPKPGWVRIGIPVAGILIGLWGLFSWLRGPRFPPYILMQVSLDGKSVPGGQFVALHQFRKHLRLDSVGLARCYLQCNRSGQVTLSGKAICVIRPGQIPLPEVSILKFVLEPGMIICGRLSNGSWLALKLDTQD